MQMLGIFPIFTFTLMIRPMNEEQIRFALISRASKVKVREWKIWPMSEHAFTLIGLPNFGCEILEKKCDI